MSLSHHNRPQIAFHRIAGLLAAAVGLFVLAGWALNIPWIKSVLPGAVEMKANTAVGLLLSGMALYLLDQQAPFRRRLTGQALALVVAFIGLATVSEYALGWRLGIDELLFRDIVKAYNPIPGRMAPFSAVAFASLGLGLAALPLPSLRWLVWLAAPLTILIGGASFTGYLWGASELVTDRILPPVAVNTAAVFILLGLGLLTASSIPAERIRFNRASLSSVESKTLAGFLTILVLLLIMGGQTYRAVMVAAESARWVAHSQQVRAGLGELYGFISDAESQERNYLLSGKRDYLLAYQRHAAEAGGQAKALAELVIDNPAQTQRLRKLQGLMDDRLAVLDRTGAIFEQSGLAAVQVLITNGEGRQLMEAIRDAVRQMDAVEANLLKDRLADAETKQFKTLLFLLATVAMATAGFMVLFNGIRRELANRTRAEKALRVSEENLSVTLHSIGDAVLATDVNGRVTRMNPIAEKLTGWRQAEALGRPIAEVFHIINEETRQPAVIPVDKVLATGEIHGLANHTVIIARDGTERPIADSAAPIRDREGRVLGVVLVFRDVTEEKQAEKAIRESEVRYRTLFDSIDEGYCIVKMIFDDQGKPVDYRFLDINPAFGRQTGLRDALGKRMRELAPQHEQHWFDIYGRIALTGEPARFQNHAAQLGRWYDVYAFRFGEPKDRLVAILFNDISERKRAEDEIRSFNDGLEALVARRTAEVQEALTTLDATADGAYIFDPASLRFTYVNKGALRQLGYTRQELLAMSPLDLNTNHEEAAYRSLVAPLIRGEKSVLTFESVFHRKDGGKFPVEINLQYITPAGGSPRFVAIVRDITERKKNEQESRRAQRLESIGSLAGGIAHDLNNALAPILLGLEIMREEYPKASQTLEMFETCAKRGADMVRQLLTFAKGAEGERVVLDPGRLVKEMDKLIKSTFPKNIELVCQCDPQLPNVIGDATQLHQVLLNLCVNARDAMPQGGTLTVKALPLELDATYASSLPDARPGKYVALRVSDTGTGIPPEILDRIFDPFFTTKGPQKGTGLGLSTVIGILKGHGGFMQVYSQPGKGSTFTAYLPVNQAGSVVEPAITKTEAAFSGQGETILFVDDEANLRQAACAVLRRLNFKPLTATDGTDGLIQVAQHRAELRAIITDLHMPHMDGLAFVRALRRNLPDIPVVVASGRLENALADEFKILGVTNFLDKPFTEAQLAAMLKTVLQK